MLRDDADGLFGTFATCTDEGGELVLLMNTTGYEDGLEDLPNQHNGVFIDLIYRVSDEVRVGFVRLISE